MFAHSIFEGSPSKVGFHGTYGTPSGSATAVFTSIPSRVGRAIVISYFNYNQINLATYVGEHSYADCAHVLGCATLLCVPPAYSKLALLKLPMGQIIVHRI